MKHLKDKQHYIDRYDESTIELCRAAASTVTPEKIRALDKLEKLSDKELFDDCLKFNALHLWVIAGERYLTREETIQDWMRIDSEMDRTYEEAIAPQANCRTCQKPLIETHKDLRWDYEANTGRVLFMYDCKNKCLPRRAFFDDGEEWIPKPHLCIQCKSVTQHTTKVTKKKITWTDTCPSCGHIEQDSMNINEPIKEKEPDLHFKANQEKYCSEKFGADYLDFKRRSESLQKVVEEIKEKENKKDLYDKVATLKKLSIPAVKDFLIEVFEKTEYRNLHFKEPDLNRIVSIEFTLEDPSNSHEHDSRMKLKKLATKALEDTNWRLMSDGINYRLGIVSGRIRVYESDDELVKLIEKNGMK